MQNIPCLYFHQEWRHKCLHPLTSVGPTDSHPLPHPFYPTYTCNFVIRHQSSFSIYIYVSYYELLNQPESLDPESLFSFFVLLDKNLYIYVYVCLYVMILSDIISIYLVYVCVNIVIICKMLSYMFVMFCRILYIINRYRFHHHSPSLTLCPYLGLFTYFLLARLFGLGLPWNVPGHYH